MNCKVNISNDRKDLVRAGNAMLMFKDVIGDTMTIKGIIIYDKEETNEKTGEIETKTVSCVKREDDEFISSISPTVQNSLNLIVGAFSEDEIKEGIQVVVKSKKSNGGRDFLYIDLV
jgi:hypothetical protein